MKVETWIVLAWVCPIFVGLAWGWPMFTAQRKTAELVIKSPLLVLENKCPSVLERIEHLGEINTLVVLEKTLESPLDCKEIQPVHPKGNQSWVFIGRTDAKAETPILRPPHAKSWLIGKDRCWEGLGAGGEGDDRGWDGWMASPTRWTWVWVSSGSCW